jgi:hypothetical protein
MNIFGVFGFRNIESPSLSEIISDSANYDTLYNNLLQSNSCLVDNLFADLWKQMGMKALLNKADFSKRSQYSRRVSFGNIGWWYKQYYTI